MRKLNIVLLMMTLYSSTIYGQNNKIIINKIKKSINTINSEAVNEVFIANSVTKVTENGKETYYLDQKQINNIYTVLLSTDEYLYISDVIIEKNIANFYTEVAPIIRIEDTFFGGGLAEEIYTSKNNDITRTISLSEKAEFDIDDDVISYSLNDQEKILYDISVQESKNKKNKNLLVKNIKNSLTPFLTEKIEALYISEYCTVFKPEGQNKFSFKQNMKNGIYQVIFETDKFYYILKVKEVSSSVFNIFTEIEPIKRVSKNIFFDSVTENIFLDEYGRFISSEILFTNSDYDHGDDLFELIEGNYKVIFKLNSND